MRRPHGKVLLVAVAIALAAGGCGDDEENPASPQEQTFQTLIDDAGESDVQATVERFFRAGNQRDAKTICALVTEEQAAAFGEATDGDCESGMDALFEAEDPPRTKVVIEDVRVLDERATVDATITQAGETRPSSLSLIKEDGEWKLTDPGL